MADDPNEPEKPQEFQSASVKVFKVFTSLRCLTTRLNVMKVGVSEKSKEMGDYF